MIKDRIIPCIEIEPKYFVFKWKVNRIFSNNERLTPYTWNTINGFVAYSYEEARNELFDLVKEMCIKSGNIFYSGDIVIEKFLSSSINDIFNEAYKKYGTPESVIDEPELLNEEE